jgi:hypothetical protein
MHSHRHTSPSAYYSSSRGSYPGRPSDHVAQKPQKDSLNFEVTVTTDVHAHATEIARRSVVIRKQVQLGHGALVSVYCQRPKASLAVIWLIPLTKHIMCPLLPFGRRSI